MNTVYQYKTFSRKDEYYWYYIDELIKYIDNIVSHYDNEYNEKNNNIILLLTNCINLYYNIFNKRTKISEYLRNNNKKHYYDDYTYSDILSWTKIIKLLETHYNDIIKLINILLYDNDNNNNIKLNKNIKSVNKDDILIDDKYKYLLDIEKYINKIDNCCKNDITIIVNNILYNILNLEIDIRHIIRYSEQKTYDKLLVHIDYDDYNMQVYNVLNKLFINHWKYIKNVIDETIL